MTLRTLIWTPVYRISEYDMDRWLDDNINPVGIRAIQSTTLELEWPHVTPEKGQEWCITDLARTQLETVDWWPTEQPTPCRVLHMRPIYVTGGAEYLEVVDSLKAAGARDAYERQA